MSGEGARSGVKLPGPRARIARQPTPPPKLYSIRVYRVYGIYFLVL